MKAGLVALKKVVKTLKVEKGQKEIVPNASFYAIITPILQFLRGKEPQ